MRNVVKLIGCFVDVGGYGEHVRNVAKHLSKRTKTLCFDRFGRSYGTAEPGVELSPLQLLRQVPGITLAISDPVTFAVHFPDLKPKICWTTFESVKWAPMFVAGLRYADEVWTTSSFAAKGLIDEGINPKIIPEGVDTMFRPMNVPKSETFRFVAIVERPFNYRKGVDVLLKAFGEEFQRGEAELLIKIAYTEDVEYLRKLKEETNCKAKVKVACRLPKRFMPLLYNTAHCYVSATRGEGFHLPIFEASWCGIPSIATDGTGHSDYISKYYKVRTTGFTTCKFDPMAPLLSGLPFLEPDREELRYWMRYVFENYDEAKAMGEKAREETKHLTWENTTELTLKHLEEFEQKHAKEL